MGRSDLKISILPWPVLEKGLWAACAYFSLPSFSRHGHEPNILCSYLFTVWKASPSPQTPCPPGLIAPVRGLPSLRLTWLLQSCPQGSHLPWIQGMAFPMWPQAHTCTFTRSLRMCLSEGERGVFIGSPLSEAVANQRKELPCWSSDKEDLLLILCFGSKGSCLARDWNSGFQKPPLLITFGISDSWSSLSDLLFRWPLGKKLTCSNRKPHFCGRNKNRQPEKS